METKRKVNQSDAKKFITHALKLGTKNNLFDKFINDNKINESELSELVKMVSIELQKNWL